MANVQLPTQRSKPTDLGTIGLIPSTWSLGFFEKKVAQRPSNSEQWVLSWSPVASRSCTAKTLDLKERIQCCGGCGSVRSPSPGWSCSYLNLASLRLSLFSALSQWEWLSRYLRRSIFSGPWPERAPPSDPWCPAHEYRPAPDHRLRRDRDVSAARLPAHEDSAGGCDSVCPQYHRSRADAHSPVRMPEARVDATFHLRGPRRRHRGPIPQRAWFGAFSGRGFYYGQSSALSQAWTCDRR